jgi:hypothetical protein
MRNIVKNVVPEEVQQVSEYDERRLPEIIRLPASVKGPNVGLHSHE